MICSLLLILIIGTGSGLITYWLLIIRDNYKDDLKSKLKKNRIETLKMIEDLWPKK